MMGRWSSTRVRSNVDMVTRKGAVLTMVDYPHRRKKKNENTLASAPPVLAISTRKTGGIDK